MKQLRVLVLDDDSLFTISRRFKAMDIELEVTCETHEEVHDSMAGGAYRVTIRALALAATASSKEWDAVIVGNNLGTGAIKARSLPREIRDITMIVWNDPPIESSTSLYAPLGFTHFGQRYCFDDQTGPDIESFLREVARELAAS